MMSKNFIKDEILREKNKFKKQPNKQYMKVCKYSFTFLYINMKISGRTDLAKL